MEERPIEYDAGGRMKYHPDFHPNHGKPYTTKENAFIIQHYRKGKVQWLSMVLGRTEHSLRRHREEIAEQGLYDHYMNMDIGGWTPEGGHPE